MYSGPIQPDIKAVNMSAALMAAHGNATLVTNPELCTLQTCDLLLASFRYIPTLAGNALFAAIFALYLICQLVLGIKFRSWSFMIATFFGLLLEIIGYVARVGLHNDPFKNGDFLIYLVCLTIAPAFLSAAIYLCLSRIVIAYGTHLSYFRPRTYTIIFCTCDFISLLLQAAGGGIASSTKNQNLLNTGRSVMLAGLAFQVVSLVLFAVAAGYFAYRVWSNRDSWNPRYVSLTHSRRFNAFLIGLVIATLTIFIRSVYRCVELSGGFDGELFTSDEALFMVLEGVMLVIACGCLTALHPGLSFQGQWRDVNDDFHHRTESEKLMSIAPSDASVAERGSGGRPYISQPTVPARPEYNIRYSTHFNPDADTSYNPHPVAQYNAQPKALYNAQRAQQHSRQASQQHSRQSSQQHSRQSSQQFISQGNGQYIPQTNYQHSGQGGI